MPTHGYMNESRQDLGRNLPLHAAPFNPDRPNPYANTSKHIPVVSIDSKSKVQEYRYANLIGQIGG